MPSRSSSSSRMMIWGVTMIIRLGVAADADVAEEAVDQRRLGEDRDAVLDPLLGHRLDAAQQHGAAVGDGDGRRDDVGGRVWGSWIVPLIAAEPPPRPLPPTRRRDRVVLKP